MTRAAQLEALITKAVHQNVHEIATNCKGKRTIATEPNGTTVQYKFPDKSVLLFSYSGKLFSVQEAK